MKLKFALLAFAATGLLAASINAQSYAITNARIVTVSGPIIEKGTVVVRDGLIAAVGVDAKAPSDAQVFDGTGLTVYPGIIDALTNVGMQTRTQTPTPAVAGPSTVQQQTLPQTNSNYPAGLRPELIAADDLRGGDGQFESVRNAGFTTVLTVGRTGIFNGRSAIIDLAGETVPGMIVREPFAEHVSFATLSGGGYPGSLLGTFSALRQMFLDAQRLQELQKMYAANPRGMKRPGADQSLEALFPIINRKMPIVFNANLEIEIVRALDFAKEFNLKAIIGGGQESWKVSDRLKAQDVPVLFSLNFPKRTAAASPDADPDSMDLLRFRAETPMAAAKLQQAGVKFAFQSGGATALGDFFSNAGKAVENGLSREAAIRSMTLGSAEILGVGDRLGSIENGKIANLTVVKGDLLGKDRVVSNVFVDGRPFEQKLPAEKPNMARPAAATSASATLAQVGGNYSITIEVPGQQLTGTLALTQQAAVLTGSIQTQHGASPLKDGKVTAEGFSFSATVDFGGSQVEVNVKGIVTGNQMSGTIDSPQGTLQFSGTRNP
ncbi:MAG: amidohydrolase family protein [Acidobacteriota bacterium]